MNHYRAINWFAIILNLGVAAYYFRFWLKPGRAFDPRPNLPLVFVALWLLLAGINVWAIAAGR